MAKYVLGLDMGITSVGWGLIDSESGEIIDKGVRLFKEGTAANNLTRRTKRGMRRLKRRKHQRILELRRLLKKNNILLENFVPLTNVYEIREKGLHQRLTNEELCTVLLNIAKKRGVSFEVVEDDEKVAKNQEGLKNSLLNNEKELRIDDEYVCENQLKILKNTGSVRGINNVYRSSSYEKELRQILNNQNLDKELCEKIVEIIFRKRDFNDGPGDVNSPTIYGRFIPTKNGEIIEISSMIEKMRGKCSVFPNEQRASKMSFTADLFNLLNDLNNLLIDRDDDEDCITEEEKRTIITDYIFPKGKITIRELCKFLGVSEEKIAGFRKKGETAIITEFNGYQKILKAIDKEKLSINANDIDLIDKIIDILTEYKEINTREKMLKDINSNKLSDTMISKISKIAGIQGYHSLSYKAMKIIIPELIATNDNQMQILTRMNLFGNKKIELSNSAKIPSFADSIYSPVAKRVHNETIKVINAVIKQYGILDSVVIEMARDRNTEEEKKHIEENNKKGLELNEWAKNIIDNTSNTCKKITSKLVQKIRLYHEQDGVSLYSGKKIDLDRLINDSTAYEIDHIIPLSISLDDSMNNKALVFKAENQEKTNQTPFQYLSSGKVNGWSYDEYENYAIHMYSNKRVSKKKLQNLLCKLDITKEEVRKQFIQKNLVDTRYASRVVLNLLTDYFKANNINTKVFTIRGQITSLFRKSRKLNKSRDNYYHHIVDALIVAYSRKFNYVNELMQYGFKYVEKIDDITGELIKEPSDLFVCKDDKFTSELRKINDICEYDKTIKISHKVDRKPNRQFTDETIYCAKKVDGEFKRISKYKNIYGKEGIKFAEEVKKNINNPEKLNKFLMKLEDPITFDLLINIVKNTTCDSKENPFVKYCEENKLDGIRKRSKNGNGPKITSIRYYEETLGNHLEITNKYNNVPLDKKVVLLQISPFRTDFYRNDKGLYKFVTIRYCHLKEKNGKTYIPEDIYSMQKEQKKITEDYKFQFSMYKNEYLKITKVDENNHCIYRFVGTSDDVANKIEIKPIYCEKFERRLIVSIGGKITNIEKYDVDVLGNRFCKKRDNYLQLEF